MIVDIHLHLYPTVQDGEHDKSSLDIWEYGPPAPVLSEVGGDVHQVTYEMNAAGVDHAILLNVFSVAIARREAAAAIPHGATAKERLARLEAIDATMGSRMIAHNAWACELASEVDELSVFVGVDPAALEAGDLANHVASMVDLRQAVGVKLHPTDCEFYPEDERLAQTYEVCTESGLVVLAHSGATRGRRHGYGSPKHFANALSAFPALTWILAHFGGGLWRDIPKFAAEYPNAVFDLSEIINHVYAGSHHAPDPRTFVSLIKDVGVERTLFGTDWPWYDIAETAQMVEDLPGLSRQEKDHVLGDNAARLLGL